MGSRRIQLTIRKLLNYVSRSYTKGNENPNGKMYNWPRNRQQQIYFQTNLPQQEFTTYKKRQEEMLPSKEFWF